MSTNCEHNDNNLIEDHGLTICIQCGMEVSSSKMNAYAIDRCQKRHERDYSIYSELNQLSISENVKQLANQIYIETCRDKSNVRTHRRACRKSLIFGSIFTAYKILDEPSACERLAKEYQLETKQKLRGVKYINEYGPRYPQKHLHISAEHLIKEYLSLYYKTNYAMIEDVIRLFKIVEDRSSIMLTSRPQSIAAGVIVYYTQLHAMKLDINNLVECIRLSKSTIQKLANECKRIHNILKKRNEINE